jgi:hypothetical protein
MVAELLGETNLGLPHAFAAAFAAAVEEEDDGGLLNLLGTGFSVVEGCFRWSGPVEVLRNVDLKFVGYAVEFDGAVQETGFLRWNWS